MINWVKKVFYAAISAKESEIFSTKDLGSTMIISSFMRLENIQKILEHYNKYKILTEIIVWHNGPDKLDIKNIGQKIKIIESDDMGLMSRYAAALLAKTELVFLHDDDLLLPEKSLLKMLQLHIDGDRRTISIEGKIPHSDGSYGQSIKPKIGDSIECEIHLNRCICTSKSIIPAFFAFLYKTGLSLSPQAGGGEDIVYSYAARTVTNKRPLAVGLSFENLDNQAAISNREGNQHKNRSKMMKVCQALYAKENQVTGIAQ
ncbi:MAG: hypothetical protein ACI9J5_001773 [Paraglaciecola sp.]|jgi:hypothetical protein